MEVKLSRSDSRKAKWAEVKTWREASRAVREYIEANDLGAGCSDHNAAFTGGDVRIEGAKAGHISYNGRAWNMKDEEIAL